MNVRACPSFHCTARWRVRCLWVHRDLYFGAGAALQLLDRLAAGADDAAHVRLRHLPRQRGGGAEEDVGGRCSGAR